MLGRVGPVDADGVPCVGNIQCDVGYSEDDYDVKPDTKPDASRVPCVGNVQCDVGETADDFDYQLPEVRDENGVPCMGNVQVTSKALSGEV
jgi:hypothetical protein